MFGGKKLKIVCVADHFLKPEFYLDCLKMFPDIELIGIPWFGSNTRNEIRKQVDKIEKEGAEAFPPPDELFEMIKDADLLMTHLCPVPRKLLEASPIMPDGTRKLKYILANRGGLENLDVQAAKDLGIPILNNPAHNGNAVAEMTIALMVMETRNLARAHHSLMQGEWLEIFPNVGQVYELRRKTIGIVGYGTIGRLVAEKLQPFNVRILAYDINPAVFEDDPDLEKWGVEVMPDMDTLLKESDIVTLHVRNNKEQIFARREFDLMKPTAYFINTARAYLVDYNDLYDVLENHRIMGAAIEVFPLEPLPKDCPFLHMDNVTLTNHRGGDTVNCYSDSPEYLLNALDGLLTNGKKPKFYVV